MVIIGKTARAWHKSDKDERGSKMWEAANDRKSMHMGVLTVSKESLYAMRADRVSRGIAAPVIV
jgi:hypothetical protein